MSIDLGDGKILEIMGDGWKVVYDEADEQYINDENLVDGEQVLEFDLDDFENFDPVEHSPDGYHIYIENVYIDPVKKEISFTFGS